jgi:hypothetical protein
MTDPSSPTALPQEEPDPRIVQRALVEALNAGYEENFLGLSYGYSTPDAASTMRWTNWGRGSIAQR